MKLINQALEEKNIKLRSLPKELQDEIAEHKELIVRYNMACEEYEEDEDENGEIEKKLDAQEDLIVSNEMDIANRIKDFNIVLETPVEAPEVTNIEGKKEEKSSVGWFVFGTAALLITLGAVNVFKKK